MKLLLALAIATLLPVAPATQASNVYRCVTESGAVKYADRPCTDGETEKLDIENRPTDREALQASAEQRRERIETLDAEEKAEQEAKAQQREEAREQATLCKAARERLERLLTSRRVTVTDEGEQRYLESEEIIQRRQDAQDQVNEFCER